jgi:hypothetical protein
MTVNINAANITSIRLADQVTPPTGVATNFINLYADTNGDIATVKGGGGGIKITTSPATGNYTLTVDGTGTAARLNANQTFTGINTFNQNIVFPSGIGLSFAATSEATGMTSEILNDYEEGTWTIGIAFGGASVGVTYTINAGTYTKIGRQVTVSGYVILSNKGTSTGSATITGLPFAVLNLASAYPSASIGLFQNITFADFPQAYAVINSTNIALGETTNAGALTALTNADFANNSAIMFSMSYFV